jgi:putative transposase
LLVHIKSIFIEFKHRYGAPRIHSELKDRDIRCGVNRVARIMRNNSLVAKSRRKFKATTNSKHNYPVHPNILEQNFICDKPNEVWTTDITYIWTTEGWLYLAVVLDLYSRKIVGWSMDKRMTRELVIDALTMAYWKRKPESGLILHSDRGSQYASNDYQKLLNSYGMICSMSKKGDCYDNAVTESFFHTLKTELTVDKQYKTRQTAKSDIFNYIEIFYNQKRKHSTLDYCSPVKYEQYWAKVA